MNQKTKTLLCIVKSPPHGSSRGKDALDTCLAAAVFGVSVSVLFIDDGVFQLLQQQKPASIGAKNVSAGWAALPLYDIDNRYVCSHSMKQRGITEPFCALVAVSSLPLAGVRQLFRCHDFILSF